MEFSVGINLGDVIEEEPLYGDGFNEIREICCLQDPAMEDLHVDLRE